MLLSIDTHEDVWIYYVETSSRRADRQIAPRLDHSSDVEHAILSLPALSSETAFVVRAEPAVFQCGFMLNSSLGAYLISHADPGVTMLAVRAPRKIYAAPGHSYSLDLIPSTI